MTVKKSAPLFAAILGLTAALGVLAPNSIGAQPGDRDDHQRHERRKGLDKIKHIVFIVKENRTFDNYFGTFPGADGATSGQISTGEVIPLRHAPDMTPRDIDHSYQAAVEAIDGGAMDRFDLIQGALVQIAVTRKKAPFCAVENSSPKYGIPDFGRGLTLNAQTSQSELSLADAVQ